MIVRIVVVMEGEKGGGSFKFAAMHLSFIPRIEYDVIMNALNDKTFTNEVIYGRNVTCGEHKPGLFPSQTWTCADIRVDGLRLAYGLYPGIGVSDVRCTETKGFDELRQLCKKLMESIVSERPLWGAFVSNASCDYHDEKRLILNMTGKKVGEDEYIRLYEWYEMDPGYGWIQTLQCMALPKDDQPLIL
ncbi:hypothetical protein FSP39_021311 [Pinctada imbricata]|uniref:Uncharacterized protein n=1 Tax=Pinctada imbricata TaxID=66713 RepID=A0AA89BRP2_PINIB|nr:hypothetical protein FSP39_021311 [Pinctada imbricata]